MVQPSNSDVSTVGAHGTQCKCTWRRTVVLRPDQWVAETIRALELSSGQFPGGDRT